MVVEFIRHDQKKVLPINNKELNDEVKQYLQNWSEKMNTPVVFVESPPP